MDIGAVKELISALEHSTLTSLSYKDGDIEVVLSRAVNPAVEAAAPAHLPYAAPQTSETGSTPDDREGCVVVRSPIVGTAYRAREPGALPLVSVGDVVRKGDTLCIIEAMKFFSDVTAPCDGKVVEIAFEDGSLAEFGAVLVILEESK